MAAKTVKTKPKRERVWRAATAGARQGVAEARLAELCLSQWRSRLEERFLPRIIACLGQLSEEEVWWRANAASNSVGNLLLHLCGNMRQWIISGLGGAADIRERDKEFAERGPIARDALRDELQRTVKESCAVLARLKPGDLTRRYRIQQYDVTGYQAAAQVEEHVAYHLGQIIYVIKLKRGKDLGFTRLPSASSAASERQL
jgi:uncharacterized damage-inducible protein DinB